jgi:quercetin dioxygenase-like cupin family protein
MAIGVLAVALALVAAGAAVAGFIAPAPVTREALARTEHPRGAPDRTLGLSRVVIQPGTELALHHHEGTQIARIEHGTLTYTVHTGEVKVRKGDAEADPQFVRTIEAGETARIKSGQWIVEQPSDHHSARNAGDGKVVIYLATLLRHGAPPSTPG